MVLAVGMILVAIYKVQGAPVRELKDNPVHTAAGQMIECVPCEALSPWLLRHGFCKITSIAGYTQLYGGTTAFVVVYEAPKDPNELP